jgi:hypothetical protein
MIIFKSSNSQAVIYFFVCVYFSRSNKSRNKHIDAVLRRTFQGKSPLSDGDNDQDYISDDDEDEDTEEESGDENGVEEDELANGLQNGEHEDDNEVKETITCCISTLHYKHVCICCYCHGYG